MQGSIFFFSCVENLWGTFPYVSSFCAAIGFIKCQASIVMQGWDDKTDDIPLKCITETITRVWQYDPA